MTRTLLNQRLSNRTSAIIGLAALFTALTVWAFASPIGSSPDDDFHLTSTWCAPGPSLGDCLEVTPGVFEASELIVLPHECYYYVPRANAAKCLDRLLEDSSPTLRTNRLNNAQGLYPGGYYLVHQVLATNNIALSTYAMRILNIAILVGTIALLLKFLPAGVRNAYLLGSIAVAVPYGVYLIPSNNPSSWAIIGVAGFWAALLGAFSRTLSRNKRLALLVVAVLQAFIAASARADAAAFLLVAVMSLLILASPGFIREGLDRLSAATLAAIGAVLAAGAVLFFSSSQSNVISGGFGPPGQNPTPMALLIDIPDLFVGALGFRWGLGWFDVPLPIGVGFLSIMVFGILVGVGLNTAAAGKTLAWFVTLGFLVGIPFYLLWQSGSLPPGYMQPRYLVPLLFVLAATALAPATRDGSIRLSLSTKTVVLVLSSVAQAITLWQLLRRYTAGLETQATFRLPETNALWWLPPVSPTAWLIVGAFAWMIAIACVLQAIPQRTRAA